MFSLVCLLDLFELLWEKKQNPIPHSRFFAFCFFTFFIIANWCNSCCFHCNLHFVFFFFNQRFFCLSHKVSSNLLRESKYFDFSHPENIMDSAFGKSFLFLTKLAWNCKVTLPVLVTAVFLAMDFRMQIELNIETEQLVFQVNYFDLFFQLILTSIPWL